MRRDVLEGLLGLGVLALGLGIVLFTFSTALGIASNPGPWLRNQLPQTQTQPTGPTATFNWTSSGLTATFTDASRQGDTSIVSWDWDFGDGQRSSIRNPQHAYATNSSYQASLVVRDANNKESAAVAQVDVIFGQTRSGRGLNNPLGGSGLAQNLDFGQILLPVATVLLTFGMFVVMAIIGGKIMMAGWSILKPKPETIRVRLKPSQLTQSFEQDAVVGSRSASPPPPPTA
ncbi:MAG TPA: PKD domain-containing protein [Thermoplasmata archaeon]|nr:PKD domain-containing protein [Thermoplasmata archaeon]